MVWHEAFPSSRQPGGKEIEDYIQSPYWSQLCSFVERTFFAVPRIEYSRCTMQKGWNVKYKKSSRPVCTLYPDKGHFICMVSIGTKEAGEAELAVKHCSPYVRELYETCIPFNGGRWLMIQVDSREILEDVKELIGIRMKKRK